MRLVFMGTPEYACPALEKLHAAHDIVMVYTQPDRPKGRGYQLSPPPIKQLAQKLGLPVHQPASLRSPDETAYLSRLEPDAVVVIAYGLILPPEILAIPRLGCINAHGSLLPKYRGASPMQQAILDYQSHTGVTTMLMDQGMDTGDMLLSRQIELGDKMISQLHDEMAELSAELLLETLDRLEKGDISPTPQDEAQASYTAKISRRESEIDWRWPAKKIMARYRAFYPWPGLSTHIGETPVKLIELDAAETAGGEPGTVKMIAPSGITIATGDTDIIIRRLQPAGKRAMAAADYVRGNPLQKGMKIGK